MDKYKFVVVGGGTAGMITASLIKKYWDDAVDVTVVYDHKNPGIGVGESLTPKIYDYLDYMGITREEMILNVNATVKIGLKFKNWFNDGTYYYHGFMQQPTNLSNYYDWEAGYDIAHNQYDQGFTYSKYFYESNRITLDRNVDGTLQQSLHIDAVAFGRFIEHRFKHSLNIVDGVVENIVKNETGIEKIVLSDGRLIEGDFFIDASGFQYVLFKHLNNKWVDRKDWLPIDRCIPNPLPWEFKTQPVYTTSEASDQGWILQVPLQNRWGTGYLYSSEFLSDDQAFSNFENFLDNNYGKNTLFNKSKVLKFDSGFWDKQWVGNCIAVGLASGFSEPLEATNIHHVVYQVFNFIDRFNTFKILQHDVNYYNRDMREFYDNAYRYLRFCYTTGRTDSNFWKYMTESTPEEIKLLEEKIRYDLLNNTTMPGVMFYWGNFCQVGVGMKKIDRNSIMKCLENYNMVERARLLSIDLKTKKYEQFKNSVDHLEYIKRVKNHETQFTTG